MLERLSPFWRNLALSLLGVLVAWLAWSIRAVLNPLLVGYLLAYILHPLVVRVERRGMSRRSAVNVIFLVGAVGLFLVGVFFWQQGKGLVTDLFAAAEPDATALQTAPDSGVAPPGAPASDAVPGHLGERVRQEVETLSRRVEGWVREWIPGFELPLDELWTALRSELSSFVTSDKAADVAFGGLGWLRDVLGSALGILGILVLVPIYTYFLLFELGRINAFVARYLPRGERERIGRIAESLGEVLSSFFRGRLLIAFLKGAFIAAGLALCGVQYWFFLGMLAGVGSLVPFAGPVLAFVMALLVATVEHGFAGAVWRTGLVAALAEILEGYVLIPKILGDSLGLHPVVVLFAIMAGGAALGLFGVLIAVPLMATVVILVRELVLPALARFADEVPPAAPPGGHAPGTRLARRA
jgi:predicted PurR-regulated permease PerM